MLSPFVLQSAHVRLEPLTAGHDDARRYVEAALAHQAGGRALPWAVRQVADDRIVGRLGSRAEGVRRAHSPASDRTMRDTAYYSIMKAEWPSVRDHLTAQTVRLGTSDGR